MTAIQREHSAQFRRLAGANMRQGLQRRQDPFDENLDPAAGRFAAKKSGGYHPRVIKHQQITGPEQIGQISKPAIRQQAALFETQQPRSPALGQGSLGNQVLGQFVEKIAFQHGRRVFTPPWSLGKLGMGHEKSDDQ